MSPARLSAITPSDDWWWWRRRHARIHIARVGEDGSQDQWMRILAEVGGEVLSKAYSAACKSLHADSKVTLAQIIAILPPKDIMPEQKPSEKPHAGLRRAWEEDSWARIADLLCNPKAFCKVRYQTEDPERVAKAQALADEIRSWVPTVHNKISAAYALMQMPDKLAVLVERRFLREPPP